VLLLEADDSISPFVGVANVLFETVTSQDGKYELREPRSEKPDQTPARMVLVRPKNGGLAWRCFRNKSKLAPIEISPARAVTGKILDAQGRPRKGLPVRVSLINALNYNGPIGSTPTDIYESTEYEVTGENCPLILQNARLGLEATTGPDGRFRLDGLPQECSIMMQVLRTPFAGPTLYAATTDQPQPSHEIETDEPGKAEIIPIHTRDFTERLAPGKVLKGRLIYADTRQPCRKQSVLLKVKHDSDYYRTQTDDQGLFEFPEITSGVSHYLSTPDLQDVRYLPTEYWVDLEKPYTALLIEMQRAVPLTGRVVDESTGAGIAGVKIESANRGQMKTAWQMSGTAPLNPREIDPRNEGNGCISVFASCTTPDVVSDLDGRFKIAAAPREMHLYLSGNVPPYRIPKSPGLRSGRAEFDRLIPYEGKFGFVEFKIGRGLTLRGKVFGPDGKPVPGARVMEFPKSKHFAGMLAETTTNQDGQYILQGVAPESHRVLLAAHLERQLKGLIPIPYSDKQSRQLEIPLDVPMQRTTTATARLVLANPPVAWEAIDILEIVETPGAKIKKVVVPTTYDVAVGAHTIDGRDLPLAVKSTIDKAGRLTVSHLIPGRKYALLFDFEDSQQFESTPFVTQTGEVRDLGTIPLKPHWALYVSVVDPAGRPAAGVPIKVDLAPGEKQIPGPAADGLPINAGSYCSLMCGSQGETDPQGKLILKKLPPQKLLISASQGGNVRYLGQPVLVTPDQKIARLVVTKLQGDFGPLLRGAAER
jgi:hypothetical protein